MKYFTLLFLFSGGLSFAAQTKTIVISEPDCADLIRPKEYMAEMVKPYHELLEADEAFLRDLREAPVDRYLEFREVGLKQGDGEDFPFAPHKHIVQRIIEDLKQRLFRRFGDKYNLQLRNALQEAQSLLAADGSSPPYKKTVRYIFNVYLPVLDLILFERHPVLKSKVRFHRNNARHLVEELLAEAPHMFLYFSFAPVDEDFFVDTRPALMNLIGINLEGLDDKESDGPFADNFHMCTSEFAYHDLGHAEFTSFRDLEYLRGGDRKVLERTIYEWEATRLDLKAIVDQIRPKDPALAADMMVLLFEVLRERGFQFSLTVLMQELQTEKWAYVIKRKKNFGFYDRFGVDPRFGRLDEARKTFLLAMERMRDRSQVNWITAVKAAFVPSKIIRTPPLVFAKGKLVELTIPRTGAIQVSLEDETGQSRQTAIREMVTAQVAPIRKSPLTRPVIEKIESALSEPGVQAVIIGENHQMFVLRNDGTKFPLRNYVAASTSDRRKLEEIEIFEINQILGTNQRGEPQAFTLRKPIEIFSGRVALEEDLVTKLHIAHVTTSEGTRFSAPLSELRIDPLSEGSAGVSPHDAVLRKFRRYLSDISLPNWSFEIKVDSDGDRPFLQLSFPDFDSYSGQHLIEKTGKRYLSQFMTKNEIIQQALALALSGVEHQVRKNFLFEEARIFGPHFNVDMRVAAAEASVDHVRDEVTASVGLQGWLQKVSMAGWSEQPRFKIHPIPEFQMSIVEVNLNTVGADPVRIAITDSETETGALNAVFEAILKAEKSALLKRFLVQGQAIYCNQSIPASVLVELCQRPGSLDRRQHR